MIERIENLQKSIINGNKREVPIIRIDELWKRICEVPGYDYINPMYWVSTFGRIYSERQGYMTQTYSFDYLYVSVYDTSVIDRKNHRIRVHRLVMLAFAYFDGCEQYEVNHKDGNKSHNWISNLEWSTRRENMKHAVNSGLAASGQNSYRATITNEQAHQICELLTTGEYTNTQIANIVGTSVMIVQHIFFRKAWNTISRNYIFQRRVSRSFSNSDLKSIVQLVLETNSTDYRSKIDYYNKILSNTDIQYCESRRCVLESIISNPYEYLNKLNNCIS